MNTSSTRKPFLLVFDKFKDALSSRALTSIVSSCLQQNFPSTKVIQLPISDGGDGFVDCMHSILPEGKVKDVQVLNPLRDENSSLKTAEYMIQGETAFMEVANSSGLQLVPKDQRSPWEATSFGSGKVMKECIKHGVKSLVIGSGGSAFVDGGIFAMTQGFGGFRSIGKDGQEIKMESIKPTDIRSIERLEVTSQEVYNLFNELEILMPCDVQNPLLGINGAAYIFGPQKGAKQDDLPLLDHNMEYIIRLYINCLNSHLSQSERDEIFSKLASTPGTGAAGGLVAALLACFKKAKIVNGMDYISSLIDLESKIEESSAVFTGEGSFDTQTLQGKVVSKMLNLCLKHKKPLYILCGINKLDSIDMTQLLSQNPQCEVFDLVSRFGIDKSMQETGASIKIMMNNEIIQRLL